MFKLDVFTNESCPFYKPLGKCLEQTTSKTALVEHQNILFGYFVVVHGLTNGFKQNVVAINESVVLLHDSHEFFI